MTHIYDINLRYAKDKYTKDLSKQMKEYYKGETKQCEQNIDIDY